jgi:hypothetical protein
MIRLATGERIHSYALVRIKKYQMKQKMLIKHDKKRFKNIFHLALLDCG